MGAAFAGELRGFGGGYPTEKLPTGMARGSLPVGGGQAAVHRRRDLAVKGLFRAGATPREELGRAADQVGRQGGCLHRRASAKRAARSPATWLRRALDLIHSTTAVWVWDIRAPCHKSGLDRIRNQTYD